MDKLPLEMVLLIEVAPIESWEVQPMVVLPSDEEPVEQPLVPLKEVHPEVEVLVEQPGEELPQEMVLPMGVAPMEYGVPGGAA
jgi:hypothetical protein